MKIWNEQKDWNENEIDKQEAEIMKSSDEKIGFSQKNCSRKIFQGGYICSDTMLENMASMERKEKF